MPNPQRYCIYERIDGKFAVTGQGNKKPSRVMSTEVKAESTMIVGNESREFQIR